MNHPLNTILYGPPGTGKTYATIQRCVDICDPGGVGQLTRDGIKTRYQELVAAGRVEFITFHQSYGYEEFVEGLRPETGKGGMGLRLKVRDGVLKRMAERAREAPVVDPGKRRCFAVWMWTEDRIKESLGDGCVTFNWPDEDLSAYATEGELVKHFKERHGGGLRNFNRTSAKTPRIKMKPGDMVVVPNGYSKSEYRAVGEVVGDYEYVSQPAAPLGRHRRAVRWRYTEPPRPVSDFMDKDFTNLYIYQLLRPKRLEALLKLLGPQPDRPPHVLVIDEINRANVAKVLGELITLLEDDKREGAENELAVTLPHSGDRFTVPANLHLLGTMNTADRSIALLDTALRRRFVFEEMTPDSTKLKEAARRPAYAFRRSSPPSTTAWSGS